MTTNLERFVEKMIDEYTNSFELNNVLLKQLDGDLKYLMLEELNNKLHTYVDDICYGNNVNLTLCGKDVTIDFCKVLEMLYEI